MLAEIFGVDGVIVIVVIAVVLFGGSQIPKLARSLGSAHTSSRRVLPREPPKAPRTAQKTPPKGPPRLTTPQLPDKLNKAERRTPASLAGQSNLDRA